MHNFQGLIKNKVEFPKEIKKNSCNIWFLDLKFPRDVITYITLPKFQGWNFVLPRISRGTEKNKKNSRVLIKKVCPQTSPVCFFSWSSPFWNNWVELVGTWLETSTDFMSRWSICIIFMCFIISIGFKKVHTSVLWYRLIGERSTPAWEVKPPFSPTLPIYIFALNILSKAGENPQPYSIL